eukprot:723724-Amphidinium_carterae.1
MPTHSSWQRQQHGIPNSEHRSHASVGECACETVGVDVEAGHSHHCSHASVGECSRKTVGVDAEGCDLAEAALGKHCCEAAVDT